MNDLFKLKRNSDTVGFMRFKKYRRPTYHTNWIAIEFSRDGKEWEPDNILNLDTITHSDERPDAIVPYVCNDRDGVKVFVEDSITFTIGVLGRRKCESKVTWDDGYFSVWTGVHFMHISGCTSIKLIKE